MKYKDFKTMSPNDMKNIVGGNFPKTQMACTCTGGTGGSTICPYTNLTGFLNCGAAALGYCTSHGGTGMECDFGSTA